MGELVRETPLSEITATMEVLDKLGVRRGHLGRIRSERDLAKDVAALLIGNSVQIKSDWFTFTTSDLSPNEMLTNNPDIFYQRDDPWWKNEKFTKERGQAGRKISLRTSAVPDSFSKTWDEQQALLGKGEFIPTVRDVIDGMIQCFRATGGRIFPDFYVRTQDVSSHGSRVHVGFFDSLGLFVSRWVDSRIPDIDIGLSSARNASEPVGSKEVVIHVCTKCWPYQCMNQSAHQSFRGEKRYSNLGTR